MSAHYVYEFYGDDGGPLYVGCTGNVGRRLTAHTAKPWWPEVARIVVNTHDDRETAWRVEAERIAELQPEHNIMHTVREADVAERIAETQRANLRKQHERGLCRRRTCPHCIASRQAKAVAS